jgi:MFS family permease
MSIRLPRPVAFVSMSAALVAFFIAAGAPTPILPLYEREWGFPPSMLTFAFGVYAVALIASLLVLGSLSDHVGRRPLLIGALALELVSMVVFLIAPSITWLIVARVLQGVATGVASGAIGAVVVELASDARKKLAVAMTSLATTAGLGVGALLAGVIALASPDAAAATVWLVLIVLMAVGTLLAIVTPETSTRRPGALAALRPHISVPPRARRLFAVSVPVIVAIFLTNALFLGLVPTILGSVFGVTDPIVVGALNFVVFAVAAPASIATSALHPHQLRLYGGLALVVAAILLLGSFVLAWLPLLWAAAVIGGAGAGASLSGITRGLIPQVEPHQRAGLFSAIFLVGYVTLGVAIIGTGYIAAAVGIASTASGYAIITGLVALLGVTLSSRVPSRREIKPAPIAVPASE